MDYKLTISLSPHVHSLDSVNRRMWDVIIALVPALAVALWVYRLNSLWVVLLCIGGCMFTEWAIEKFMMHHGSTLSNGSAIITGLLLAFNLPAGISWWMAVIGAVVAIGIGKMSFGGLGCNIWNPALVGRVFLLLSFPAAMTTWDPAIASGLDAATGASVNAHSGATLLATINNSAQALHVTDVDMWALLTGERSGSLGETGIIAIALGLIWMLCRRVITWHIPVAVLGSAAIMSAAIGRNPLIDICAGGLMLGAVFMATDYVTSPMTQLGKIIYGVLIGVVVIIIRAFGSYPEGTSFAILLGNSVTPLINMYCRPRVLGERRGRRK